MFKDRVPLGSRKNLLLKVGEFDVLSKIVFLQHKMKFIAAQTIHKTVRTKAI